MYTANKCMNVLLWGESENEFKLKKVVRIVARYINEIWRELLPIF